MRYVTDTTWTRFGDAAVLAGSPMKFFRFTADGSALIRSIEAADEIERSPAVDRLLDRLLDAGAIHPAPLRRADIVDVDPSSVTVVTPQHGSSSVVAGGRLIVDDATEPPLIGSALRLDENVGPAGARNAGRTLVRTPFVLFLDADVDVPELDPDHPAHRSWWAGLLRHFADPLVGLVAPRVAGDAGASLDLGVLPARIRTGTRVSYVPGAAMLVRIAAFDDVGGFDPALRTGEDVDFVWRLDQTGWRCRYEPTSVVDHRPRATWWERILQQVKYGSSSGPLSLRHPRAMVAVRLGRWSAAVVGLLAFGRTTAAAVAVAASVVRLRRRAPEIDPEAALRVALSGHVTVVRQLATTIRRAWWPFAVPLIWSRRVRRLLVLAMIEDPRRVAFDVAFSIGLWRSVLRTRDFGSIRPRVS